MQAHPQSTPAARINSTSHPASITTPPQQRTRALLTDNPATPSTSLANTTGLAHDAGNLLAALGLYCDLLSVPGVLRPEHRHYATELSLISNRSSELIQRLLALSEPTTSISNQTDDSASPSTNFLLRNASASAAASPDHASALRNLAPVLQHIAASAAKVSVTCPASLPPLNVSAEIIERITVNLVRNAAEALRMHRIGTHHDFPRRGRIRVTLAVVASHLHLTVEDNGPGMPPDIAAEFLQPSPLPPGATHGLGLRIVHELATATAGQLSIRVIPDSGTIICIKWPLAEPRRMDQPSTLSAKSAQEGSRTC